MTILLLSGNAAAIHRLHIPLTPEAYGWFLTTRHNLFTYGLAGLQYAVDNEAFTGKFEPKKFVRHLLRVKKNHGLTDCLFVVAPDVVADAQATLDRFVVWQPILADLGFPVALAAQDGLQNLPIPWDTLDAIFVGGTTEWKLSEAAATIMWNAHARGKWLHAGRVNSVTRLDSFKVKPDSIDGTHWVYRPDIYLARWHRQTYPRSLNQCFPFLQHVTEWHPDTPPSDT